MNRRITNKELRIMKEAERFGVQYSLFDIHYFRNGRSG